jgi:hypothetical protein
MEEIYREEEAVERVEGSCNGKERGWLQGGEGRPGSGKAGAPRVFVGEKKRRLR